MFDVVSVPVVPVSMSTSPSGVSLVVVGEIEDGVLFVCCGVLPLRWFSGVVGWFVRVGVGFICRDDEPIVNCSIVFIVRT